MKRSLSRRIEFVLSGNAPSIWGAVYARTFDELVRYAATYRDTDGTVIADRSDCVGVRYKGQWVL